MVHVLFAMNTSTAVLWLLGSFSLFSQRAFFPPFNPSLHLLQRFVLEPCRCMVWWVISLSFHVAEGEESSSIRWCHLVIYHVCTERQSDVYS